jgi:peptidoglycan hydrolase CwlO-like protein
MKNIIISILCSFYNYGSPHKYSSDNTFIQENWWNQQKWWNSYKDTDNFTPLAAAATTQAPIHQIQAPTQYIQPQIERLRSQITSLKIQQKELISRINHLQTIEQLSDE